MDRYSTLAAQKMLLKGKNASFAKVFFERPVSVYLRLFYQAWLPLTGFMVFCLAILLQCGNLLEIRKS